MSASPAPTEKTAPGGRTQIADVVVSKIAGLAAREIGGVHALGGGAARAFGAFRERIPGGTTNASQGVSVEVGPTQAAIDIDLVVGYGAAIAELAAAIRGIRAARVLNPDPGRVNPSGQTVVWSTMTPSSFASPLDRRVLVGWSPATERRPK